ncbi:porin [Gemmobacter denitrificans]|uniref:Porin n=1 Tax=Gemmobacter denitrificans TaxID=3123040 RepID=A0ABU8BSQ7_9RHOB
MKKILLATALLSSTATVASAETGITFSGYGRFGLEYVEGRAQETQIASRMRININGKTETDSGVTFGGRLRLQSTDGGAASTNAALFFAEYEGFRLEVGNANTAFDSAGLLYASEMGFQDSSAGDPQGSFFAYNSTGGVAPGVGIFASYSVGDFTGRISYATPDQTTAAAVNEEISLSVDYASGPFSVSLAAYQDGAGIANNDGFFVGAAYAINDQANVGLNYIDEDSAPGKVITLYGNYTFGATTVRAYVADMDAAGADTAFGLGADYDLGGARLSGSIQSDYAGDMNADLGVRFDF